MLACILGKSYRAAAHRRVALAVVGSLVGLSAYSNAAPGLELKSQTIEALENVAQSLQLAGSPAEGHLQTIRLAQAQKGFVELHNGTDAFGLVGLVNILIGARYVAKEQKVPSDDFDAKIRFKSNYDYARLEGRCDARKPTFHQPVLHLRLDSGRR
jgi:hypothetical protein